MNNISESVERRRHIEVRLRVKIIADLVNETRQLAYNGLFSSDDMSLFIDFEEELWKIRDKMVLEERKW